MPGRAGQSGLRRALVPGFLIDVVVSCAAVLLAKRELGFLRAPGRSVPKRNAVGLGGSEHRFEVRRDTRVHAEITNERGGTLRNASLDVVTVRCHLSGASEEERPRAAANLAAGRQSIGGLKLLGRGHRAGAKDTVNLELGAELVQSLLGGFGEDASISALDEGDERAESGRSGRAVGSEPLGLLERLDLLDRIGAEDAVTVRAEPASGQEVLQALDRVDTTVGSDKGILSDVAGSKATGSNFNVGDLAQLAVGFHLLAMTCKTYFALDIGDRAGGRVDRTESAANNQLGLVTDTEIDDIRGRGSDGGESREGGDEGGQGGETHGFVLLMGVGQEVPSSSLYTCSRDLYHRRPHRLLGHQMPFSGRTPTVALAPRSS